MSSDRGRNREREIADLERGQFGLVSSRQLRAIGLSQSAVDRRVRRDRHDRIRRGVLVSPSVAPSFETHLLAAVLAGGKGAFASHESALRIWASPVPDAVPLEITTCLERRPRLPGVRCHRSRLIVPGDVTCVRGIPVSNPARTLVDISSRFDLKTLGRLVDDALRRRIVTLAQLEEATARLGPAPGRSRKRMRVILARRDANVERRESSLEDFVHHSLRRFRLPTPETQYRLRVAGQWRRIDFCYVAASLALEPKGFGPHSGRQRFDSDTLRGNELELAGFRVLEFTSAFTDWLIASQVAQALCLDRPRKPRRPLTFLEWLDRRDRLGTSRR